jgi:sRNA-binding protein
VAELMECLDDVPWARLRIVPLSHDQGESPEQSLARATKELEELQARFDDETARRQTAEAELASARDEAGALRENIAAVGAVTLTREAQEPTAALVAAIQAYSQGGSVLQALKVAIAAYPTRIRALPSALSSAEEADSSLSASGVLQKLMALCGSGWDALASGAPMIRLRGMVPGTLACQESDTVMHNPRLRQERVFTERTPEGARKWEMQAHISLDDRHRLYFIWDAEAEQIVVGHCGRHLAIATTS